MIYLLSFIVVLGVLIFVHEFGHFIMARRLGIGVTKFSFGFGPKLFGIKRGETEYLLSAIPLGGYVNLVGESEDDSEDDSENDSEDDSENDSEDDSENDGNEYDNKNENSAEEIPRNIADRSFNNKPTWVKIAVIAAGPLANLIFAVVVFWFVFLGGIPALSPKIGQVLPDTPAEKAGLMKGDIVIRIDEKQIKDWEELAAKIRMGSSDRPLVFTVIRNDAETTIPVIPEIRESRTIFGEKVLEPKIGIASGHDVIYHKTNPWSAFLQGFRETGKLVYLTVMTVVKLVTRVLPSDTLGGPILIAQIAGDQARQGISSFAYFLGLLSVNLGILNLLPIPILDGGHIVFFSIEGVIGRRLSLQTREVAQKVGLALILMLTALVFYNDIVRLLSR